MKKMLLFTMLITSTMLGACNITPTPQKTNQYVVEDDTVVLNPVDPLQILDPEILFSSTNPQNIVDWINTVRSSGYGCPDGEVHYWAGSLSIDPDAMSYAKYKANFIANPNSFMVDLLSPEEMDLVNNSYLSAQTPNEDSLALIQKLLANSQYCNVLMDKKWNSIGYGSATADDGSIYWFFRLQTKEIVVSNPAPIVMF